MEFHVVMEPLVFGFCLLVFACFVFVLWSYLLATHIPKRIVVVVFVIVFVHNLCATTSKTIMNTYAEDKENCNPRCNSRNIPAQSNFGKARGFSALLESATKENENDLNFSVAVKAQCQDISSMVDKLVGDFRQEDKDSKYARDLHESDLAAEKMHAEQKYMREHKDEHAAKELYMEEVQNQKERAKQRQSAEHKDESAALSVAMQERRDIQKRAQSKREMEAKDCDFAKQTVLDDLNSHQDMEEKCSNDEKVALAVRTLPLSNLLKWCTM